MMREAALTRHNGGRVVDIGSDGPTPKSAFSVCHHGGSNYQFADGWGEYVDSSGRTQEDAKWVIWSPSGK
jgi:hypothetical protein